MYKEFVTELSHQTSEIWDSHNRIDDDSNIFGCMLYFKLPPRCKWDLRSSGMLRSVEWYFATDVAGNFLASTTRVKQGLIFSDVIPCRLLYRCRLFEEEYCHYFQSQAVWENLKMKATTLLQTVGNRFPIDMV